MQGSRYAQLGIFILFALFVLLCSVDASFGRAEYPGIAGSNMIADQPSYCTVLPQPPRWWLIPASAVFVVMQNLLLIKMRLWILASRRRAWTLLLCSAVVILIPIGVWQCEEYSWEHSCWEVTTTQTR